MYTLFMWYLLVLAILSAYFSARLIFMIVQLLTGRCNVKMRKQAIRTLIVIGSGGHTSEMLRLMKHLNKRKFTPRLYVLADTDTTSQVRVEKEENGADWTTAVIPRSRHVNQSYSSSIVSTLYSIVMTIPVVISFKPDLILCNGPGTCVPVCLVGFIMRLFHYTDTSIIFVESICRVKSLSLTGKIMCFFADLIIVQWPELKQKYRWRVKYVDEDITL